MKAFAGIPLLLMALAAGAQTPPTQNPREAAFLETVSVTGTGRVRLEPDRVMFTIGVETVALTVDDAVKENNIKVAQVLAALRRAGAKDSEVTTSNFAIFPQQEYRERERPKIIGYQVSNSISVMRDNPSDAGKLLQAAISAGVNTASGLNFMVADPARGRESGLKGAFADARAKAETLAQAAGRRVGRAISITEGSAAYPPQQPIYRGQVASMAMKAEIQQDVPVSQGSEERVFTVSVIFELR